MSTVIIRNALTRERYLHLTPRGSCPTSEFGPGSVCNIPFGEDVIEVVPHKERPFAHLYRWYIFLNVHELVDFDLQIGNSSAIIIDTKRRHYEKEIDHKLQRYYTVLIKFIGGTPDWKLIFRKSSCFKENIKQPTNVRIGDG